MSAPAAARGEPKDASFRLVAGLGSGQLVSWGVCFYAPPAVASAMARDLAVPRWYILGAFTFSLLVSGLASAGAGALVDRRGARMALTYAALLAAVGIGSMASAENMLAVLGSATIVGVAMSLGLYDTAFAAVLQVTGTASRRLLTGITLLGGLASTVFWPLTLLGVEHLGWRLTLGAYAFISLLLVPVHRITLSEHGASTQVARPLPPSIRVASGASTFRATTWAFAMISLVTSALGAHVPVVLSETTGSGVGAAAMASSIGIMQVLARTGELAFGGSPIRWGLGAFAGVTGSVLGLLLARETPWMAYPALLLFGASAGLVTTVRASVLVTLFGSERPGALFGASGAPATALRAVGPVAFATLLENAGHRVAFTILAVAALSGSYVFTTVMKGLRKKAASNCVHRRLER